MLIFHILIDIIYFIHGNITLCIYKLILVSIHISLLVEFKSLLKVYEFTTVNMDLFVFIS